MSDAGGYVGEGQQAARDAKRVNCRVRPGQAEKVEQAVREKARPVVKVSPVYTVGTTIGVMIAGTGVRIPPEVFGAAAVIGVRMLRKAMRDKRKPAKRRRLK